MALMLKVSNALNNEGQSFPFEMDIAIPEMEIFGDRVSLKDVHASGTYVSSGENISIQGSAKGVAHASCARCLRRIEQPVQAQFEAEYAHHPDPEDPDQYSYDASELDLTDAVRDSLVLELPIRFLCKEDCKGLCPVCGTDLNTGTCTCREGIDDMNPFSVLRSIVQNNEEV